MTALSDPLCKPLFFISKYQHQISTPVKPMYGFRALASGSDYPEISLIQYIQCPSEIHNPGDGEPYRSAGGAFCHSWTDTCGTVFRNYQTLSPEKGSRAYDRSQIAFVGDMVKRYYKSIAFLNPCLSDLIQLPVPETVQKGDVALMRYVREQPLYLGATPEPDGDVSFLAQPNQPARPFRSLVPGDPDLPDP